MRITTKNYFKALSEVGFENLPEALKKSHLLIEERTDKGKDWSIYEHNNEVKKVFDLAFEKLYEFIDKKDGLSGVDENSIIARAKSDAAGYKHLPLDKLKMIYRLECDAELEDGLTDEIKIRKPALEKAIAEKEGKTTTKETMKQESPLAEKFVKRFLLLHGKTLQKKEIEGFLNEVQNAIKEKEITKDSVLSTEVLLIQSKLLTTVNNMGRSIKVELAADTKRKFQLALNKLKAKPKKETLNGIEKTEVVDPKQNLMNSIDFAKLHFNSIGFSGKWLNLIGDPSPGFTAMVFGRPKMGKSYLCVDLAGYLARNHGTVLYVANEEKLDATLQIKLNDKDVKHENLFVSDYLPEDLSKFQFIILDSVNKLGLSPQDLENLKRKNPGKSFIFIFQTTKDGKFKGANSYQHDVDVVIEVPERGKATQFGRFNQGGEMSIFDDAPQELSGVKKSEMEIDAELPIPLGELFIYIKHKGEKEEDVTDILDNEPERAIAEITKIVNSIIKKKKVNVKVLELEHAYNDSYNVTHGVAYFSIKLSGAKADLKKIAGEDKEIVYDWEDAVSGVRKSRKNLEVPKKVSNVDTMKKKATTIEDWTEPAHLNKGDHAVLKEINRLYKAKKYKEAMNRAMETDTIVREEIPGDIWKKMGGQLTKIGEEKLKAKHGKSSPEKVETEKPKQLIVFNSTIRALKEVIEREWDLELTDGEYIEILDIAQEQSVNFYDVVTEIHPNLTAFMTQMGMALKVWDKTAEKSKGKFDPRYYANRKDDDNPSFIFSLTSSKLLAEAIEGDFDLIYLVRKELANRGQDSNGKWVGFDEAAKIHRIQK